MAEIQEGEEIGAGFLNRHEQVADWYHRTKARGEVTRPQTTPINNVTVLIRNNTGADLRRGEVVELDGSLLTAPDPRVLSFSGVEPDLTHVGWAITLQQIPDGSMNDCLCIGVCIAFVDIVDEDHEYAKRIDGSTVLESAAEGPVKILHKPTGGTPPEERECVVQLMDEVGGVVKIVTASASTLYAAFGGGYDNCNVEYDNADSNALAISTGNYIPLSAGSTATKRNRVVYPQDCIVWARDSNGALQATAETISCFNPGSLPISRYTFCTAEKCHGSEDWVITGLLMPHASPGRYFRMADGATTVDGNSAAKIIRNASFADPHPSSAATQDWCHSIDSDIYIHHPGTYEITFGAEVARYTSDSADDRQWTDSNGDTIDLPTPMTIEVALLQNWNPVGGSITGAWPVNSSELLKFVIPGGTNKGVTSERKIVVSHSLDTWHGYPYMRLSFAMFCISGDGSASGKAVFNRGWVQIRPCNGGVEGGNQGSGYNAFLGTSGAFNWHGGGTAPAAADFDEDGL